MALPEFGWTIHRLADLAAVDADQRDGAIIGGAISALIISLLLYLVQRQRAYRRRQGGGAQSADGSRRAHARAARGQHVCCRPRSRSAAARKRGCAPPRMSWCRPASSRRSGRCRRRSRTRSTSRSPRSAPSWRARRSSRSAAMPGRSSSNLDLINGLAERMAKHHHSSENLCAQERAGQAASRSTSSARSRARCS